MTIRNRLKLIGLVPITLLIIFSIYFFITSYVKFEKANALKTSITNNAKLSIILTQVGKERDLTAMYLGSTQKEFSDSLSKQRKNTDLALVSTSSITTGDMIYIPSLLKLLEEYRLLNTQRYQTILNNIKELPTIRTDADTKDATFKSVFFGGYTKIITTPILDNLIQIKNFTLNIEISSLVSTLSQLYIAKENAGLERGLISYHILKKDSMFFDEMALWHTFKTKANVFNINHVSNQHLQQQLNKIFTSPENIKIFTELTKTSSTIQTDIDNSNYEKEAMDWFTLQTQKISLLQKAELIISKALWEKSDIYLQEQLLFLTIAASILLLSFILAYLGYITSRDINSNIKELEGVLNKAVDENYFDVDTSNIANINLNTHEGTKAAYTFLKTLVGTEKEDKYTSLQTIETKHEKISLPESNNSSTLETLKKVPIHSNTTEDNTTSNSSKKILIAKKFLLERRILIKVINNLGYNYHSLENMDTLMQEIHSDAYDIVFTDKEFVIEQVDQINDEIKIITTNKPKEELEILIMEHRN